ncbi:uncharacterized protein LOC101235045 isoform X4 [Hydra vulgaris]|uniref:Uncharacterized protein LOC101235045 isoform X4 n=1 Tax=Hydra vulgaris TaxID=6087 RepID=A0ABM4BYG6_HYDVU
MAFVGLADLLKKPFTRIVFPVEQEKHVYLYCSCAKKDENLIKNKKQTQKKKDIVSNPNEIFQKKKHITSQHRTNSFTEQFQSHEINDPKISSNLNNVTRTYKRPQTSSSVHQIATKNNVLKSACNEKSNGIDLLNDLIKTSSASKSRHSRLESMPLESTTVARTILNNNVLKFEKISRVSDVNNSLTYSNNNKVNCTSSLIPSTRNITNQTSKSQTNPNSFLTRCTSSETNLISTVTNHAFVKNPKSVIENSKSVVRQPTSTSKNLTSAFSNPISFVTNLTSVIAKQTSLVSNPTSAVTNPTWAIINPTSAVINPTWAIINPTSAVTNQALAVNPMLVKANSTLATTGLMSNEIKPTSVETSTSSVPNTSSVVLNSSVIFNLTSVGSFHSHIKEQSHKKTENKEAKHENVKTMENEQDKNKTETLTSSPKLKPFCFQEKNVQTNKKNDLEVFLGNENDQKSPVSKSFDLSGDELCIDGEYNGEINSKLKYLLDSAESSAEEELSEDCQENEVLSMNHKAVSKLVKSHLLPQNNFFSKTKTLNTEQKQTLSIKSIAIKNNSDKPSKTGFSQDTKKCLFSENIYTRSKYMNIEPQTEGDNCCPPGTEDEVCISNEAENEYCLSPGTKEDNCFPPGTEDEIFLPPGTENEYCLPPGSNKDNCFPPGTEDEILLPPGTENEYCLPPGSKKDDCFPPGTKDEIFLPPGTESSCLPSVTQIEKTPISKATKLSYSKDLFKESFTKTFSKNVISNLNESKTKNISPVRSNMDKKQFLFSSESPSNSSLMSGQEVSFESPPINFNDPFHKSNFKKFLSEHNMEHLEPFINSIDLPPFNHSIDSSFKNSLNSQSFSSNHIRPFEYPLSSMNRKSQSFLDKQSSRSTEEHSNLHKKLPTQNSRHQISSSSLMSISVLEMISTDKLRSKRVGDSIDSNQSLKDRTKPKKRKSEKQKAASRAYLDKRKVEIQREAEKKAHDASLPCPFFKKKGFCDYGDQCRFSHKIEIDKRIELCKFYVVGACRKENNCLFMHEQWPCRFYHVLKSCNKGSSCKYSHEDMTPEVKKVFEEFELKMEESQSVNNVEAPCSSNSGPCSSNSGTSVTGRQSDDEKEKAPDSPKKEANQHLPSIQKQPEGFVFPTFYYELT